MTGRSREACAVNLYVCAYGSGRECVGDRATGWTGDLAAVRLAAQGDQERCGHAAAGCGSAWLCRGHPPGVFNGRDLLGDVAFGLAPMSARIIWPGLFARSAWHDPGQREGVCRQPSGPF